VIIGLGSVGLAERIESGDFPAWLRRERGTSDP